MKVAIFTDTFLETNGVTTYIKNTMKELRKHDIETIVFAPGKTTHMEYYEGSRVYFFKSRQLRIYPDFLIVNPDQMYIKLCTLLEMENPDIYHIQDPFTIGFMGMYYARKFKKPLLGTYHTLYEEYAAHLSKGRYKKLMQYLLGKTSWPYATAFSNRCDVTIAPGAAIAKILTAHNINNVTIVPNGVDLSKIQGRARIDVRKKYGLTKDSKIFLHLGRISFEKKIDLLLKAFKELDGERNYLLIVGTGPKLDEYKRLAQRLGLKNVIFTGYIDEKYLSSYYHAADIFVTASDTETFSIVIIEAFAAGKPVVGPNYLGANDLIIDNFNGLKFKRGDYKDMAEKMRLILSDNKLKERLSKNAKKFSEKYENSKTTDQLIKLYKNTKYKPFKLKDLLSFWPYRLKTPKKLKNNSLIKYLKRLKIEF
jgi:1,2-diacylglycerol 3-alpha-glucosyltransferase